MDVNRVQYLTSSGTKAPICRVYFCRHCLKLRSSDCVSHEVDSHYCPNCLENMPSAEAKLKKNRCGNCFDCPSCQHTLSTRATSISVPCSQDANKAIPKKVYYLACGFCRWTSRDVAIPDQTVANGSWPEQENPNAARISNLLDYYRQLAQKEKAEKEKKKYIRRRSYLHLSDKYGLTPKRNKTGTFGIGSLNIKDIDEMKNYDIMPSVATDEIDALPDEIFTKPINLTDITTLDQRFNNPEFQSDLCKNIFPRHKCLLIKRSQRCRECEHNLSKPEFNPASIKFKIQLAALLHIPEVRIMQEPSLIYNQETQLILTLFNPLDNVIHVVLDKNDKDGENCDNAELVLPSCNIPLAPRDDAAEFDDTSDQQHNFQDNNKVIVFRKANKVGFFVKVKPYNTTGKVQISFRMRHEYINATSALHNEKKTPQVVELTHYVYLTLGEVVNLSNESTA